MNLHKMRANSKVAVAGMILFGAAISSFYVAPVGAADIPRGIQNNWTSQYKALGLDVKETQAGRRGASPHILDKQALTFPGDKHPEGIVIRRTEALLTHIKSLKGAPDLKELESQLNALKKKVAENRKTDKADYLEACRIRRAIALSNPLLDFDEMIFVTKSGSVEGVLQCWDYGYGVNKGGGLFKVSGFKQNAPKIEDILKDSVVERGRMKGRKLTPSGGFNLPTLSYDGKTILFSYVENPSHSKPWPVDIFARFTQETCFHIYKVNADGTGLEQITDGKRNDYHPCFLPGGRIVFVSDRRNVMDRCQGGRAFDDSISQMCGTLHSMKLDGSDMIPISYHETTELMPNVNNDGMILFTRWDYVDRDFSAGHHLWVCYPDGRDARAPHGNYALPHYTSGRRAKKDGRSDRPWAEYNIKAIPGSRRYMAVAGKHHVSAPFGTLVLLDTSKVDDNEMSQVTLFHNYALPDEGLQNYRGDMDQGLPKSPGFIDPWPLSEAFVIAAKENEVYLLDKFGNEELLFKADRKVCNDIQNVRAPIPFTARKAPPAVPIRTHQGERYGKKEHKRATISIMNVYDSDFEWPKNTKIKWMRVMQLFPYPWHSPWQDKPRIGPGNGANARAVLGVVPVEEDGSVYFEAPVEKAIYFQALDENGMAVQSMRSSTYVHPGEQMSCLGCHEKKQKAPSSPKAPMALKRPPSKLVPNLKDGSMPLTYARLVKPLLESKCNACHEKNKKPQPNLGKYQFFYHGTGIAAGLQAKHGGYRTEAGKFGAIGSGLAKKMLMKHHREALTMEEINRITLWADANSNELGAYHDVAKQRAGEVVWPAIDMDPLNPAGIDLMPGRPAPPYPDANTPMMKTSEAIVKKTYPELRKTLAQEKRAAKAKWIELFNGKDLTGWEGDETMWRVKDGVIYGSGPTNYKQYLINRSHTFKDFILEVKFMPVKGNSGVNYRSHDYKKNNKPFEVSGYQCDIGPMGALYDIYTTSKKDRYGVRPKGHNHLVKSTEWNTFEIVADGKELYHYINGSLVTRFTDKDPDGFREKGFIAFELHDRNVQVKFKDIRVKELK